MAKKFPTIYHVKKEQVGSTDLADFLRNAIHRQFANKDYYIAREEIVEMPTHYSTSPRQLRGFMINENGKGHAIWFDVTDISTFNWAPGR